MTRAAGLAAAMLAYGAPAPAQAPSMAIMLSCAGTDEAVQQTGTTTTVKVTPGIDPGIGSAQHRAATIAATASTSTTSTPDYSRVKVPAHLSIAIEGERIRVKPSDNNRPGLLSQKKSADGWYELTEVSMSDTQIRGQASYGGLFGKYKLVIDRLTGDARFGGFSGVCDKQETGPRERKF